MQKSFLLTFFFASVVFGFTLRSDLGSGSGEKTDISKTFYAKVNGQLQRLRIAKAQGMELIGIAWPDFNEVPLFSIEYGVVSTEEGQHATTFGKFNGFLALGYEDDVTPYRLLMDGNQRVMNLEIRTCQSPWGMLQPRDIHHQPEVKEPGCEPYEIYFLSPKEAERRNDKVDPKIEL